MRALLITGGNIDVEWASEFVKLHRYDLIVAVDGGLSAANLLNICPDVVIGDFDTADESLLARYEAKGITSNTEIIRLKPEKNDTDTQYAMKWLIERRVSYIDIIGAIGTRMDHTLLNIYNLQMAHENGVNATIYDKYNKMYIIEGSCTLKRDEAYGKYISLMQLTPVVKDVTLKGFKYNVENYDFCMSGAYRAGCSNEFEEEEATVNIGEGSFVVVEVSGD